MTILSHPAFVNPAKNNWGDMEFEMAKKNQHVVHRPDGWAVRGEGNTKDTVKTETKREAIEAAKEIAKNNGAEVVIHGKDGKIQDKDSYGRDPNPPKDRKP